MLRLTALLTREGDWGVVLVAASRFNLVLSFKFTHKNCLFSDHFYLSWSALNILKKLERNNNRIYEKYVMIFPNQLGIPFCLQSIMPIK